MAKSLDQLIEFLLDEIALGGEEGVTLRDVVAFVKRFYAPPEQSSTSDTSLSTLPLCVIDRRFLVKIWQWLTRHPDISTGGELFYDNVSLDQVDVLCPGVVDHALSDLPTSEDSSAGNAGPRISVSKDLVSHAICGHGPDPARVPHMEFQLLSAIAAARHDGILQGELRQKVNQDKRSVPRRTDMLHAKGYIVKRTVWMGGQKTSRLTLRRYVKDSEVSDGQFKFRLEDLALQIVSALNDNSFTSQDDLATALSMIDPARRRVMDQVVRALVRRQCLKRVKTALGQGSNASDLKLCLQVRRQPEDTDWHRLEGDLLDFDASVESAVSAARARLEDDELDNDEAMEVGDDEMANLEDDPTIIRPQWNPDRLLPNALVDLVKANKESGTTNGVARKVITGLAVRRPIESLLVRLSHVSLRAQPAAVRDLAIVRSTEKGEGSLRFVHRDVQNYNSLVEQGQVEWASVVGGKEFAKQLEAVANDPSRLLERDTFDFVQRAKPKQQAHSGEIALEDVAKSHGAAAAPVRSQEAILLKDSSGQTILSTAPEVPGSRASRHAPSTPHTPTLLATPSTLPKSAKAKRPPVNGGQGRPRRFTAGTEKFWREMFLIKKLELDPTYPKRGLPGLTNEPECVEMHKTRPVGFDDVILAALQNNLPLPDISQNVSQDWKDRMRAFIDRRQPGVYFTPSGMPTLNVNDQKQRSCLVILRSSRLGAVDFTKRIQAAPVLFIASSVAHSFHFYRHVALLRPSGEGPPLLSQLPARARTSLLSGDSSRKRKRDAEEVLSTDASRPATPLPGPACMDLEDKSSAVKSGPQSKRQRTSARLTRSNTDANVEMEAVGSGTLIENVSRAPGREGRRRKLTQKAMGSMAGGLSQEAPIQSHDLIMAETPRREQTSSAPTLGMSLQTPTVHENGMTDDGELEETTQLEDQEEVQTQEPPAESKEDDEAVPVASSVSPEPLATDQVINNDPTPALSPQESLEINPVECYTQPQVHEGAPPPSSVVSSVEAADIDQAMADAPDSLAPVLRSSAASALPSPAPSTSAAPKELRLLKGRDAVPYYKKFFIELVQLCGGVMPHVPSMFKRAIKVKCTEAHIDAEFGVKLTKSNIGDLVKRGKLKIMNFAFQRNGFNHVKAIIALPHIKPTDGQFLALSQKMSLLPPEEDYIPPEVGAETKRKPGPVIRQDSSPDEELITTRISTSRKPKKQTEPSSARHRSLSPPPPTSSPNVGFLTLKVPGIASVQTQNAFTTSYYSLPAQPLSTVAPITFNTDASAATAGPASPTPLSLRRSGIRIPRASTYNQNTGKIQWRVPKMTALPKSLRALLGNDRSAKEPENTFDMNPDLTAFERAVDYVRNWEERTVNDLQDPKPGEWIFMNHQMRPSALQKVRRDSSLDFRQIIFDANGSQTEIELPDEGSSEEFQKLVSKGRLRQQRNAEAYERRKRKFEEIDGRFDDSDDESGAEPTKRRKRGVTQYRKSRKQQYADGEPVPDRRRLRKPGKEPRGLGLRHLPRDIAHKVTVAFVVARTLAGGLDRFLDWKLVARLVPEETEALLRERWKTLAQRYIGEMDALTQDLQIKYLDALAEEKVPTIDFNNLVEGTDWEGILAWALANINSDVKETITEIPPSREELLVLNKIEVEEPSFMRGIFNNSLNFTAINKEHAWCASVTGETPNILQSSNSDQIKPAFTHEDLDTDLTLVRARSWVLATVLTTPTKFNPTATHKKLLKLGPNLRFVETLVDKALKQLQLDKLVQEKDRDDPRINADASTASGTHSWKLSQKYFDRFNSNRYIAADMLREAAGYKLQVLDTAFVAGESVTLPKDPNVSDGRMMCIFNLVGLDMLRIVPGVDVPNSRYGLDWENGGYQTRVMDKNVLGFSVVLEATDRYAHGDPLVALRSSVSVPRGGIDQHDGLGLIPGWFDINHEFRADIWEMILGAVIGLVSARPGLSSIEVVRILGYALPLRDVEGVMRFLEECGAVIRCGVEGWETTEWWWFALGTGTSVDGPGRGWRWNSERL